MTSSWEEEQDARCVPETSAQAGGSQAGPACLVLHLNDHLEANSPPAFVGVMANA